MLIFKLIVVQKEYTKPFEKIIWGNNDFELRANSERQIQEYIKHVWKSV